MTNKQPDWTAVLNLYGDGGSDVEVAKLLGITYRRFVELEETNPAFAELVDRGRTLSRAWWYETGRKSLFAERFNGGLYNFNMKNRFGWADKVETNDTSDKNPVDQDQLRAQLQTALKKLGKKNPELLSGANLSVGNTHDDE